jgi:hypothetical protein
MKRIPVFFLVLFLFIPFLVHAQGLPVIDAAAVTFLEITHIDQVIHHAQSLAQTVQSVQYLYQQTVNMFEAEKRALENLRSIADVRSFDDFMKWQNRQLYMEKEVEDRFNNLGVKIGGKTYRAAEIDEIPDAMRSSFKDPFEDDFTEEQRKEMYLTLGLAPGNYNYVKKWQEREADFVRRIQVQSALLYDENKHAAKGYNDLIEKYSQPADGLDMNQILKNMHITQMQTEMVLREIARQNAEKYEYDIARNKLAETPPTPLRLSDTWNAQIFEPITENVWSREYQ